FSTGLRNSFTTRDAALIVQPDRLGPFRFPLNGNWAMSPDHNLTLTINGVTSTLDGFVSDPMGRFIFHFANLDQVLETNVLGFVGYWSNKTDANGTPLLDFHYRTPSGEQIFELPQAVAIKRSSNQLAYTYTKDNKNFSIDFQGMLMIGPSLDLTYVVQPQVSSSGEQMVSSSTLAFQATLNMTGAQPNIHGDLELSVGASTFSVGGQYQVGIGSARCAAESTAGRRTDYRNRVPVGRELLSGVRESSADRCLRATSPAAAVRASRRGPAGSATSARWPPAGSRPPSRRSALRCRRARRHRTENTKTWGGHCEPLRSNDRGRICPDRGTSGHRAARRRG